MVVTGKICCYFFIANKRLITEEDSPMSFDSIQKGLEEAIKVSDGEVQGRKQKVSIQPDNDSAHDDRDEN